MSTTDWTSSVRGRETPVPASTMALLAGCGTSTLTGDLIEMGFRNPFIAGLSMLAGDPSARVVGRARTLRFVPRREDLAEAQYADLANSPHRRALETLEPGEILVVDVAGTVDTGVLGDMFARRIRDRGGVAVVIDGAIRDLSGVREVALPLFARAVHGGGIERTLMSAARDELIRVCGVTVVPGDVIVADADGIVAIPPHVATQLAEHSSVHEERERWIRQRLDEGGSLSDYYPPTPEREAELLAWLADRARARDQS